MRLHAAEWGDPKGLPVALLHAFPMSGAMWLPQKEALAGFRVLVPDLRGFGGTPASGAWLIEHAADDILETMAARGFERAALVGLSMGGYVALRAARKAPERVLALALCDTRAEPDADENKEKRAAAIDFVRARGVAAFVEPFLKDALAPETIERRPEAAALLKKIALEASSEAVCTALAALAARPDAVPGLSRLRVPVAVLVGARDRITPLPLAEAIRSRVPGAQLHVIPEAGHFSGAENPDAFNARLLAFLGALPRPA